MDQIYQRVLRMERRFYPVILTALNNQVLSFIAKFRKYGYYAGTLMDNRELDAALRNLYRYTAISEAGRVTREIERQARRTKSGSMGSNPVWIRDVNEYLDKYLLAKSTEKISATTRALILNLFQDGIRYGYTQKRMIDELLKILDINRDRALKIVRTELTSASNFGYMMAAFDSKYEMNKVWISVGDNRVRRTHKQHTGVDGEIKPFSELFSNGLLYPGDPEGKPSEIINCRCRIVLRIRRDANGKAILRQTPPVTQYLPGVGMTRPSLVRVLWENLVINLVGNLIGTYIGNKINDE